ncbi:MAG: hypothetical protein LBB17_02320 [Puniceicoccales bacterium]|nr:hypothetical protein [Puniceicoccales bacterium]
MRSNVGAMIFLTLYIFSSLLTKSEFMRLPQLAARSGFEPKQTESESVVLFMHKYVKSC